MLNLAALLRHICYIRLPWKSLPVLLTSALKCSAALLSLFIPQWPISHPLSFSRLYLLSLAISFPVIGYFSTSLDIKLLSRTNIYFMPKSCLLQENHSSKSIPISSICQSPVLTYQVLVETPHGEDVMFNIRLMYLKMDGITPGC